MTNLSSLMAGVLCFCIGAFLFLIALAAIVKWNDVSPDQLYAMLAFF